MQNAEGGTSSPLVSPLRREAKQNNPVRPFFKGGAGGILLWIHKENSRQKSAQSRIQLIFGKIPQKLRINDHSHLQ